MTFGARGTTMVRRSCLLCAVLVVAAASLSAGASSPDGRPCSTCLSVPAPRGPAVVGAPTALTNDIGGGGGGGGGGRTTARGTSDDEGRGKKKKKMKNTSVNMMVGGSVMTALVVIFIFLNTITMVLGKAFLFTFITKFLVTVNWASGDSSSKKKSSHKDITVLME